MRFKRGVFAMLFSAVLLWGCGGDDPTGSDQTGRFKVYMTDAPARFEAVNVTFTEISAHIDGEWVTVQNDAQTINLLEWNNGKSVVIGDADMPAGQYSQIRLKIDGATVVQGGQTETVDVPSGAQSGLKLNANFEVNAGSTYELLIDFDAHRSVVETGSAQGSGSAKFILKPTLRAVPLAITGSISGTVSTMVNAPVAFAISGSDTVTSTAVDSTTGEFKLAFLPPGDYTVVVQDTSGAVSTNSNVQVAVGANEELGTLNLQVGVVVSTP